MKTFDTLTKTLRYKLEEAIAALERRQAAIAKESLVDLGYTFRQRCDDVIKEAETLRSLERISRAHENVCRMAVEEGKVQLHFGTDLDEDGWWMDKADHLTRWITRDCMTAVTRGVNLSNNPLYLVEEAMKVEAAKAIFGAFISGYMDSFFDDEVLKDIFDGMRRREREEEERRAKRVTKVIVKKLPRTGCYFFETVNHKGETLEKTMVTQITQKPLAKARAEAWAQQLREEQTETTRFGWSAPHINVEFK